MEIKQKLKRRDLNNAGYNPTFRCAKVQFNLGKPKESGKVLITSMFRLFLWKQ